MADNFEQNREALDKFNQSLRDSIDLSKELVRSLGSLPSSIGLSASKNKQLVDSAKQYSEALKETEKLVGKVSKGRIKDKDITDQITRLEKKYQEFIEKNKSTLSSRSKFVQQQRDLQKEITKLEEDNVKRTQKSLATYTKIDELNDRIVEERKKAYNTLNPQEKKDQLAKVKLLQEEVKEGYNTIRVQEAYIKDNEKTLSQKIKEKDKIKEIVDTHKKIKEGYEQEIKEAKILLEVNKQNSAINKILSGDLDRVVEGLKDLSGLIAPLVAGFEIVKKYAYEISSQAAQLQRNLVVSSKEAYSIRSDFNNIAVSSEDIAVTTARMVEANESLGKQLGFNTDFSADLNIQFIKLTKQIGLSEESAGGLAKLAKATGLSLKDVKNVTLGISQQLSSQYGIQLDQKDVLEEIGKISGQTLAMFKANPKALAEAVAQSKLLGTNLDTVKKQAMSLLDFESSIENELQAELLTGRQLYLERARSAALTGDLTTAMKELNSQNIDFNTYSKMNVIAQNKVADALGLSSDELTNQLLKQQYLNKSREEIVALGGEEVAKRLEALSAQDKFNLAVEKMKDIIGVIAAGPLGKITDWMASMAEKSWVLVGALSAMAGISMMKLITQLGAAAVQAGILGANVIGIGTVLSGGALAAIAAAAVGIWALNTANAAKTASTPLADGGIAYGPTNALVGEYAGANTNPEVVAPLSDLQTIINQGRGGIGGGSSQETLAMLATLNQTMKDVKSSVNQIGSKEGKVYLGSQQVGTAQLMGNYNLA